MTGRPVRRSGRYASPSVFFLVATLYGAVAVPGWLLIHGALLPALLSDWAVGDPVARHGHEMLMGYALAVVGGFLFTRLTRPWMALALAAWLAGRVAVLAPLPPLLALPLALAFPLCLFAFAALPFLRAAKGGPNAVFGPLITVFAAAELLFQAGRAGVIADGERLGTGLAFHLLALLLFTMGGRIIPAATAGGLRRRGVDLPVADRVQPVLERLGIAGLVLAMVLSPFGAASAPAGAATALAGLMALARLARWRSGRVLDQPALWSLHLGYLWLGVGLILAGPAALGWLPASAAVHAVAIGGLGTLTLSVMARVTLQRGGWPVAFPPALVLAVGLVSGAALLRLGAALHGETATLLAGAGALWSAAETLALIVLARTILARSTLPVGGRTPGRNV